MPLSHFSLHKGLCSTPIFFYYFFSQIQKHSSEQLCMHLGLEKLKATKCRGSSSVNVALETDISQSAAQKSFYSLSQYFSDP